MKKRISKEHIRQTMMSEPFNVASMLMMNFDRDIYSLPDLDELKAFLKADKINYEHWSDSFRCGEFAKYLALAGARNDWACAALKVIRKNGENVAHYVVIFFTTTGWYIIEPQTDGLYPYEPSEYRIIRADFN